MKGFLDKTWAKAAAFVLTLVFGVLTVLGGVGVGILISYDVFLDGGDFLRQTMYEGNCVRSIDTADSFLRGTLANAGVLVSDGTYDYSTVESGDVTEEERAQVISDLPRVFAEEFSRDAADCHLTVTVRGNGEVVGTFENFELTDGDKPLYTTQETFTYALNTGNTAMVTIAADLLRTEEDAEAIRQGVIDGTVDVIVTDHAPHTPWEKAREFELAPFGMIGLETSLSLVLTELVNTGKMSMGRMVELMAIKPREILGLDQVQVKAGSVADLTVFDASATWTVGEDGYESRAENSGFAGRTLAGRATDVFVGGKQTLADGCIC